MCDLSMINLIRRLIFYPAGKLEEGGKDHVSIYARIENVGASMQIDAELKFFIYNHNNKQYSVFQGMNIFTNTHFIKMI